MKIAGSKITILLETIVILVIIYSLWHKVLLPYSYFVGTMLIAVLLAGSIIKGGSRRYLIFQILLVYLLIRNIYGLATYYSVIPVHADCYRDYGVTRTFLQKESIFVISPHYGEDFESTGTLTWYSGWPLIHTLALILSQISGIDIFHVALMLPSILSLVSFAFVYLLVEKIRSSLNLTSEITTFALLIYATSPDAILWSIQFVRQNFGLLLLSITLYLACVLISRPRNSRYKAIMIFIVIPLVIAHHFTSFMTMLYFFLLFVFLVINNYISKMKIENRLFRSTTNMWLSMALIMFAFLFVWWNNFSTMIWPTVKLGVTHFLEVIGGAMKAEFYMPSGSYPDQLTPAWLLLFMRLRDIVTYVPSLFGLLLIWVKRSRTPLKFFVVYSMISFGLLFAIDNLVFREVPYRLLTFSLPFVALLTAISYDEIKKKSKRAWNIFALVVVMLIVLSSFTGLWGHNYAPTHLYDPSVNRIELGENADFTRLHGFLNEKILTKNFEIIWADNTNPLFSLLEPSAYAKIKRLFVVKDFFTIGSHGNELVCAFNDLSMYLYYHPEMSLEDAKILKRMLEQHLESNFNRIYDDWMYKLWANH